MSDSPAGSAMLQGALLQPKSEALLVSGPTVVSVLVSVGVVAIAAADEAHLFPSAVGHWPRGVACACYVLAMIAAARWAEADSQRSRSAENAAKERAKASEK